MQQNLHSYSKMEEINNFSPKDILKNISKAKWRNEPYKFQNWANWLHRMSAYVGKIKPGMAHWIIKSASKEGDVILDPFCGIGTVPLESDLLGRQGIGVDLNPYAFAVSRAKFDRVPIEEHLEWLDSLKLNTEKVDLNETSAFMKKFYHPKTLKEIMAIKKLIFKEKKYFLLGCLLGIIHGHRPGHLSAVTSLVIPYNPKTKAEYREVIPRLKQKVKRMYKDGFPLETNSKAIYADSRELPLDNNSVDLVISSPPYFNTLDYVNDNRLRLEFLGYDHEKKEKLKTDLIQDKKNYLEEMRKIGMELKRVIKNKGYCIFILGDMQSGKIIINTGEEVRNVFEEIGFKFHGIIEDAMPTNKCIPSKIKRNKFDRILVMTNEKIK